MTRHDSTLEPKGVAPATRPVLSPGQRPERVPVSYGQRRLWFIDRLGGSNAEYNVVEGLRFQGPLDTAALERALNAIVARHESLRTRFDEAAGEPFQIVERELRIEVPSHDLTHLPEQEQRDYIDAAIDRHAAEPFSLSRGPVLRFALFKLAGDEHVLLRCMHHIVSDGWSQDIFHRELLALDEAFSHDRPDPLRPLPIQFTDFALWQRQWLDAGALSHGLEYWTRQLAGISGRLDLLTGKPRPASQTFDAGVHEIYLSAIQLERLKLLSRQGYSTLYMTLLTGVGVLLSRYSGQEDIVIGSPVGNRQDAQLEGMIGFFVNMLAMRVQPAPGLRVSEYLNQVRNTALEAYRHQETPFERLVEELAPKRSLNTTPLFQVSFALQNTPAQDEPGHVTRLPLRERHVRFDLEINAREENGQLRCRWLYNRGLFEAWHIEQMAEHLTTVLEGLAANPDRSASYG